MTSNKLSKEDILERGDTLAFPDSMKALMRGDLGQINGGFPAEFQAMVLKGEAPYTNRPNAHLAPIDFEKAYADFQKEFDQYTHFKDFLSYQLYPKVFTDYYEHFTNYGAVRHIPTPAFFYGLKPNEEILIQIDEGKEILVQFLNKTKPDAKGMCTVSFKLNGQNRAIEVRDHSVETSQALHRKAEQDHEVGSPLQGSLSKVLVQEGDVVEVNAPLFIIEAMKMESTITAPMAGKVLRVHLAEKTLVEQDDLVVELEV